MGLAPYGEPRFAKTIPDHLIDLKDGGSSRPTKRTEPLPMRVTPPPHSRFDRLPARQRAATVALTVLPICIVLLLLA